MDDRKANQRGLVERAMEEFKLLCIKTFSVSKRGEAIKKQDLPKPRHIIVSQDTAKIQDMIDQTMP